MSIRENLEIIDESKKKKQIISIVVIRDTVVFPYPQGVITKTPSDAWNQG